MQNKLKRNMRTKENRKFWAGVEKASEEFKKLPQWEQDMLKSKWDKIHEEYANRVPTCHHCGADLHGRARCFPCYG